MNNDAAKNSVLQNLFDILNIPIAARADFEDALKKISLRQRRAF